MAAGRVSHGFDVRGRFYLHADLPADEGAIVAQATVTGNAWISLAMWFPLLVCLGTGHAR